MIDEHAPVRVQAEVEIQAGPALVWDVMTAVTHWRNWNPDVRSASIEGPVAPGTRFHWKVMGGSISSTFRDVVQPRLLSWTGRLSPVGIEAVHVWTLEPRTGWTLVRTEESWRGRLVGLLQGPSRTYLKRSLEKGLQSLKRECERRAVLAPPERRPQPDD